MYCTTHFDLRSTVLYQFVTWNGNALARFAISITFVSTFIVIQIPSLYSLYSTRTQWPGGNRIQYNYICIWYCIVAATTDYGFRHLASTVYGVGMTD